jgi:hypothetical protein
MGDGQLCCRVTAWELEQAWEPLLGRRCPRRHLRTAREAARRRRVWRARSHDDTELLAGEREQVAAAAAQAELEAAELERKVARLREADDVRADWYAHTAVTRDHAIRALAERGVDLAGGPKVTAEECRPARTGGLRERSSTGRGAWSRREDWNSGPASVRVDAWCTWWAPRCPPGPACGSASVTC